MVPCLPRLRRGTRPRTADDDDWGTASPPYDMPTPMDLPLPRNQTTPKPRDPLVERLKQQELTSYTLVFSPRLVITLYFAIAILFLPLGIAIVAGTSKIHEVPRTVYSGQGRDCEPFVQHSDDRNDPCAFIFNVTETIPPPSYFYYSITNFHQNHRVYAKSRSDTMNQGKVPAAPIEVDPCEPFLFQDNTTRGENGFDPSEFRYPCGLTARSFFNDTFEICKTRNCDNFVRTTSKGISIETDRLHKFRPGDDPLFMENQSLSEDIDADANELLTNEHFIVWMRLSAFPNFDKLYSIIEEPLLPNVNYTVRVNSNYPVRPFDGTKAFRISTVSWFGGPNIFLGTAYVVVGFTALIIAITLLVKHLRHPRLPASSDPDMILRELAKLNMK